jgi:hypothetical protein
MWHRVDLVCTDVSEDYPLLPYFSLLLIYHVALSPSVLYIAGCFRLVAQSASHLLTLVPRSRIFLPWSWRRYVAPKRRLTQNLYDGTSQNTAFFIVTTVRTSDRVLELFHAYERTVWLSEHFIGSRVVSRVSSILKVNYRRCFRGQ